MGVEIKKGSHIGETIVFTTNGYNGEVVGEWSLTINNVYKTDKRNQFEDPINQVVVIVVTKYMGVYKVFETKNGEVVYTLQQ